MDQVNKEYWFPVHAMAVSSTAQTGSFECCFRLSNLSLSLPRNSGKDAREPYPFWGRKMAFGHAGCRAWCPVLLSFQTKYLNTMESHHILTDIMCINNSEYSTDYRDLSILLTLILTWLYLISFPIIFPQLHGKFLKVGKYVSSIFGS